MNRAGAVRVHSARLAIALVASIASSAAGCATDRPSDPAGQGRIALPTAHPRTLPSGEIQGCSETLEPATIHGAPGDRRVAWLVPMGGGRRIDLVWPSGYTARFDPALRVLDQTGAAVLAEGDYLDSTCAIGDPIGRLMAPPFLALRLECGPMEATSCTVAVRDVATAAGWPGRPIATLRFTSTDGRYVLVDEGGTQVEGTTPQR